MTSRTAFRAGMFYPGSADSCQQQAQIALDQAHLPENLPAKIAGGIVPHAGWAYSGYVAAQTLKAVLGQTPTPEAVILFGADHCGTVEVGEVYPSGSWETPVGEVEIDSELADLLLNSSDLFRANPAAHQMEHSLEVQLPLIKMLAPEAKIVPIGAPISPISIEIGETVGKILAQHPEKRVVVVGSSDFTHCGGHFGSPGAGGPESESFARKRDLSLISQIEKLAAEDTLAEALGNRSACGPGAIAATISATRQLGATAATLIEYTNSYCITHSLDPSDPDDTTVGYASIIFH